MIVWIVFVLAFGVLILWQRQRLLRAGDAFGGRARDEHSRPGEDADPAGRGER
jgi:hypothetical protein